jgi:2-keto-4-pentenoate hydratase/2-oxohepta-3-ene-1,7-dioic acid hydratase in catechol pathway
VRLARSGGPGRERPVVSGPDGIWRDLLPITDDITADFLARGMPEVDLTRLPEVYEPTRFGPPLSNPGMVVCIGLNYRDHAGEPEHPCPTNRPCTSSPRTQ